MKTLVPIVLLCVSLTSLVLVPTEAVAQGPAYLIPRPPARTHKGHAYYPGRGYGVTTQTYAYGWFGAKPRRHWTRSTGYSSAYIQWTSR